MRAWKCFYSGWQEGAVNAFSKAKGEAVGADAHACNNDDHTLNEELKMPEKKDYLVHDDHIPGRARHPVVDAHNHLWGNWTSIEQVVAILDEVGVETYCDLTANVSMAWEGGGYRLGRGSFSGFREQVVNRFPGRFYGFTTATLAPDFRVPIFDDARIFAEQTVEMLRADVDSGACGLKVLKELGLRYRDTSGALVNVDDPHLAPIWAEAGKLGIPVLIHQSDPYGFFEPVTPDNEHADTLLKFTDWQFSDRTRFPSKRELLERRDRLVAAHPDTTFILPHIANWPENLAYVGNLLDRYPNVLIDISARLDELGRQPYTAREFLIHYADRILFGSDMPVSTEMYRCYFRFLETRDEYFVPPDYDGTFGRHRWRIYGVHLPDDVLRKIYRENACRVIPGLDRRQ